MAGFANDVVFANNGDFSIAGSSKGQLANGLLTNGQMWIGTTSTNVGGTHINVGTLTSPDSSITIGYSSPNITLQASSSLIKTINGDSGSITGSTVTIFANKATRNSGATVAFVNSGTVSTFNVSDADGNTFIGNLAGNLSGLTGIRNVGLGPFALTVITGTSSQNTAIGDACLTALTGGNANCAIGDSAGIFLVNGSGNTLVGSTLAGGQYTGSESNNICLGHSGVTGDNDTIRIGATQTKFFGKGITGVTVAASSPIAIDTNGQISDLGFGTATNVLTSNGAGVSPSWQAAGGGATSPIFQAFLSANQSNVTGDNTVYTIPFDSTAVNTGSAFNTGTGVFTAPATGTYLFTGTVYLVEGGAFAGMTQATVNIVATSATFSLYNVNPATMNGNATLVIPFSSIIQMTAGDTAHVTVLVGNTTKTVLVGGLQGLSAFAGYKIA